MKTHSRFGQVYTLKIADIEELIEQETHTKSNSKLFAIAVSVSGILIWIAK
ncbi:hypothetical protein [Okeania sp. KiyG1]|uniref:hypothetical protein n=1 Tax=Okeania sp. KiyG1 TaxID=2720165 RepID=UPI00192450CD|nr:hypothetical protein [Okeania sp. KiyG1]GGA47379.1 hypothetical protein CYANOKiyG1_66520 [Okeania sp. KiyG1]